jgi:type IV pilus assembly protein PilC
MAQTAAAKLDTFQWEGVDKKGSKIKGESRAANAALVKADLRRQGIIPARVRKKSNLFQGASKGSIKPKDIAVFSRQMATMMTAGVPIVQALDIIGRGHENPAMQTMVMAIKGDVEGGTTLTDSIKKHPRHFDELFCNLVNAGEQGGVLEALLDKIAIYKEKTESIKAKIKKALFYPTAVVIVAIIVSMILLVYVVPQFAAIFESFGADLPAFTQFVIHLSNLAQSYWWAMMLLVVGAVFGFIEGRRRSQKFSRMIDRAMLKVPVIGPILHKAALARFARTTATMFAAGVPLVDALKSVAGACGNIVYQDAVMSMRDEVSSGQQMQQAMKNTNLFPNLVVQMVAIGEESGSIDDMLNKVADFYEEEVDNAVDSLSSLLEPLIMAILGVLVGGLVIAMYLPIFKLGSVV